MRRALIPVGAPLRNLLLLLWIGTLLLWAPAAQASPPDLVWRAAEKQLVHLLLSSGAELEGRLLEWDETHVVVARDDGRLVTMPRDEVERVSLRLEVGGGSRPEQTPASPGRATERPTVGAPQPSPRPGTTSLTDDLEGYQGAFQGAKDRPLYLQGVASDLANRASSYGVDQQRAEQTARQLRDYATLADASEALDRLASVTLIAVGLTGSVMVGVGLAGKAGCSPSDPDVCRMGPLVWPGIIAWSVAGVTVPVLLGASAGLMRRAVRTRESAGFIISARQLRPSLQITILPSDKGGTVAAHFGLSTVF